MMETLPVIHPDAIEKIKALGEAIEPYEACGIILGVSDVIQLPNHSDEPLDSYSVDKEDVLDAIEEWLGESEDAALADLNLVIWHTHPGGNIGPSRGDLRVRVEGVHYVVVTLPGGEAAQY